MRGLINIFFLIICFLLVFCGSSKRIQFSKKYIPVYNPGGQNFLYDQKFSKSYELYQKHRNALKEKTILAASKAGKKISQLSRLNTQLTNDSEFTSDNDTMINSYGIDLARVKGAKFIDVIDESSYYEYGKKDDEQKLSLVALPQKIRAGFEEIGNGISLKIKDLHKKKSINSSDQETIVNFNNYNKVECDSEASDYIQEEDNKVSGAEVETFENGLVKDDYTLKELKRDMELSYE